MGRTADLLGRKLDRFAAEDTPRAAGRLERFAGAGSRAAARRRQVGLRGRFEPVLERRFVFHGDSGTAGLRAIGQVEPRFRLKHKSGGGRDVVKLALGDEVRFIARRVGQEPPGRRW